MSLLVLVSQLPKTSGVYHYFDKNGKLLYVGKAKSLKDRVRSYFKFTPSFSPAPNLSPRIYKMISETAHMSYIVVESEHDALILENSLIKQLKPKYNILLRDDKTFPYIYINQNEEYPRPEITRKSLQSRGAIYYGPFSSGAREILDSLYELYPLVQKRSCLHGKKVCLFYQIKKCVGACEKKMESSEYKKLLNEALSLIENKKKLVELLSVKMSNLAEALRYEEAGVLRDRCEKIKKIESVSQGDFATQENIDLFAIYKEGAKCVSIKMFMRNGKLVSSSHKSFAVGENFDLKEAYKRALLNYYDIKPPIIPQKILLGEEPEDFEEIREHIYGLFGKKVDIGVPKSGDKKRLLELAFTNTKEILRMEANTTSSDPLSALKELFDLESEPARIEVFDNSHMFGSSPVGAMVVYEDGEFAKDEYRHYNLEGVDEYSQMKEMLMRRIESFDKSSPPDLWVLDGGKAQLNLALELIASVGVNLEAVAISKEKLDSKAHRAKGSSRDVIYVGDDIFRLEPTDKRLQFLQKLRDESHRFAVGFHRKQKLAKDKEVSLLAIKGIKEAKLKRLLDYFGTFERIKEASLDELCEVLDKNSAMLVCDYYK